MLLPRISLDWPSLPCWPNRKSHWTGTRNARGLQRDAAFYTAKQAKWACPVTPVHKVHVSLIFCAPSKRRYDLDNALAAMKGAIDGLSQCLGIDDSKFTYTIERGDPCKEGGVIVVAEVV